MYFTWEFWRQALERAIKTAAQAVLGIWAVADQAFNVLQTDWEIALGAAVTGAALSILFSIVSSPFGEKGSPSAIEMPPPGPQVEG